MGNKHHPLDVFIDELLSRDVMELCDLVRGVSEVPLYYALQQIEHRAIRAIMNPNDPAPKPVGEHLAIQTQPRPIAANSVDVQPTLARKLDALMACIC